MGGQSEQGGGEGYGVSARAGVGVAVSGTFDATASFGATALTTAGSDDTFVTEVCE